MDEKTHVRLAQHRGVVVGNAGGNDVIIQGLQRGDGFLLLVWLAQLIASDAVVLDDEAMAKKRRPVELLHQRLRELFKRVGQYDDLHERAKFVQKFLAAGQRLERADDFL